MAIYNEAYTLNELSKNDSAMIMESINRFFDNNQRYINETFNELNFQFYINEADGDKKSIGQRIKSLVENAIAFVGKIYNWIKNKLNEIREKISNFFKNRKLKKEKPEQREVKAPANAKDNDDNSADKFKKNEEHNKNDIKAPAGDNPLMLEEPVDLSEIIDLMKKENFCPKLNAFAYNNDLYNSIDGYITALTKNNEDKIKEYTDLFYKDDGDYNNWNGSFYARSAKSMLSAIRKKYYSDTITDKRGYYSDIHVDPEDSKEYDKIFKRIEEAIKFEIELVSSDNSIKIDLNSEILQYKQVELRAITQAYNDVTRCQAQNLAAYNQFIEAIPRFADKVRANRRNKSNE